MKKNNCNIKKGKAMKKIFVTLGISCVLSIMVFSSGAAPIEQGDISSDITRLKKEVIELRERIKSLEERLEKATIIFPDQQPLISDFMPKTPDSHRQYRSIPKGWKQKEFNGHLYYVIPIENNIKQQGLFEK
jgi:hypothetical protein